MADEKSHPQAFEQAARAIHEAYYGAGTWKAAGTPERSHARQSVRLALSALTKNGLSLSAADDAKAPAKAAPAAKPATPRPAPRRF